MYELVKSSPAKSVVNLLRP